ncbi:hypothetical protein LAZ67_21001136, partial [Cordylochernes scorpioides]
MEKIILRRLTYHLDTRNLLPEEQYGFRKGHGTIDQLLFFTQKLSGIKATPPKSGHIGANIGMVAPSQFYGRAEEFSEDPLQR